MPDPHRKTFVLDTNVILHDSSCIYQFDEHDVVIPITVIEELDKFKKGKDTLNCNAREFVRSIDALTGDKIFNGGVPIAPEKGKITIALEKKFHAKLADNFSSGKADHRILNTAFHVAGRHSFEKVVLVTKDVNLRMKAKSIGLMAQDYTSDHVKDIAELYKGRQIVENIPETIIDQLYHTPFEIDASMLPKRQSPEAK